MNVNTELTPAQQRLHALRAEVAAMETPAPADTASAPHVAVGDTVHAVATGLSIPRTTSLWGGDPALTLTKGDEFIVTQAMLDADVDRYGNRGWSGIVHDADAQLAKWGKVYLAPGPAPSDLPRWEYGDPQWSEDRETARRAAWSESDPERRAEALSEVKRVYGDAPTTSTVLATYRVDKAFEAQQERIRAAVANGTQNYGRSRGGE